MSIFTIIHQNFDLHATTRSTSCENMSHKRKLHFFYICPKFILIKIFWTTADKVNKGIHELFYSLVYLNKKKSLKFTERFYLLS